jgi:hypothetical protein
MVFKAFAGVVEELKNNKNFEEHFAKHFFAIFFLTK